MWGRSTSAIARVWWGGLGLVGLSRERWLGFSRRTRRTVKAVVWVAIGLPADRVLRRLGRTPHSRWRRSSLLLVLVPYQNWTCRGRKVGTWVFPGAVLLLAITYPFYVDNLPGIPIFLSFPEMSTMVAMIVFAMMALGLNIVVGYAGLLDLGYVAFYAIGAYMAGWFASDQFAGQNFDFGAVGLYKGATGIHLSIWLVLPLAGLATALVGVLIGLPTLRLRGDYLAIVTLGFGEIMPQIVRNGDNLGGFNLTNGAGGITPIDGPGLRQLGCTRTCGLPANYLNATNFDEIFFWTVARARADHDLL